MIIAAMSMCVYDSDNTGDVVGEWEGGSDNAMLARYYVGEEKIRERKRER